MEVGSEKRSVRIHFKTVGIEADNIRCGAFFGFLKYKISPQKKGKKTFIII